MNRKSMSLQRLSMPKPNSPTKKASRLQFPVNGDSSLFVGVGKKHLVYTNQSTLDKMNILELSSPRPRERKMTMPEAIGGRTDNISMATINVAPEPVVKRQVNTNPQDSLSMMEQRYSSKQLFQVKPDINQNSPRQPQQRRHPVKPLQQDLIENPRPRLHSLPQLSPQKQTPISRYNISEMRRFNPTFLSSAIQVENKLPAFLF